MTIRRNFVGLLSCLLIALFTDNALATMEPTANAHQSNSAAPSAIQPAEQAAAMAAVKNAIPIGWKPIFPTNEMWPVVAHNLNRLQHQIGTGGSTLHGSIAKKAAAAMDSLLTLPYLWHEDTCLSDGIALTWRHNEDVIVQVVPRIELTAELLQLVGVPSNMCARKDPMQSAKIATAIRYGTAPRYVLHWQAHRSPTDGFLTQHQITEIKVKHPISRNSPLPNLADQKIENLQLSVYRQMLPTGITALPVRHLRALSACLRSEYLQPEKDRNVLLLKYLLVINDTVLQKQTPESQQTTVVSLVPQPMPRGRFDSDATPPDPSIKENYTLVRSEVTHCIVDPRDFMVLGRYQEESPYFLGDAERPNAQHP